MQPIIHLFFALFAVRAIFAKCFIETSKTHHFPIAMCHNTSIEDFAYELVKVDDFQQEKFNIKQLYIKYSNFSTITYMISPQNIYKDNNLKNKFIELLSINHCEVSIISNGSFTNFVNLDEIDLSYNKLKNIDFVSDFPSTVSKLNVSHNIISHVNMSLFKYSLETLDLSYNAITSFVIFEVWTLKHGPVYGHLYLNNNIIREIYIKTISGLKIDLSNNNIHNFSLNSYIQPSEFELLDLSGSVRNLDVFSENYFVPRLSIFANNEIKSLGKNDILLFYSEYFDFSNCSLDYIHNSIFKSSFYRTLNFSRNNLKVFDDYLFGAISIYHLDMSFNQIENISNIFQDTYINHLNLTSNNISELTSETFKSVRKIIWLDLSFNSLKLNNNSFKYCEEMTYLNLAFNNLTDIPSLAFNGLSSLRTLILDDNFLTSLSGQTLEPLIELKEISISNNKLAVIESGLFSSMYLLKSIELSGNFIENISFRAFNNLSEIDTISINNNKCILTIASEAFFDIEKIDKLQIKNSKMQQINLNMFSEISVLNILDLSDNSDMEKVDFSNHSKYVNIKELVLTLKGTLRKKSFLKSIFLEKLVIFNSVIDMIENRSFQGLFNLKSLEIVNTKIRHVSNFALGGLFAIEEFNIKNFLKITEHLNGSMFRDLHSLRVMDLSQIGLKIISPLAFEGLRTLASLDLSHNLLSDFNKLTFFGLNKLESLDLSSNKLKSIATDSFKGLISLNRLILSNNFIKDVQLGGFQWFPNLQFLSISRNNLTEFKTGTFSNLHNLTVLNLEHNSLSSLSFSSFLSLRSISKLKLAHNNLKTIDDFNYVRQFPKLRYMSVAHNKWKCDYLGNMLVSLRKQKITYSSDDHDFETDNVDGIQCIDVCKYLLCLKDSHGIN